jgi:hypothetical protein
MNASLRRIINTHTNFDKAFFFFFYVIYLQKLKEDVTKFFEQQIDISESFIENEEEMPILNRSLMDFQFLEKLGEGMCVVNDVDDFFKEVMDQYGKYVIF